MADRRYQFTISAQCVVEGEDSPKMFDATVTYHNMGYDDVVLVEKHLIQSLDSLNKYAEEKALKKTE